MAAPSAGAGRGFLDDPSKQSSPAARPPRNPAAEPTSPPSAASEQPAATTRPFGDAAAAAEDAYAETTQRLSKLNVDAVVFSPQATFQTAGPAVWNVGAAEFRPQALQVQVGGCGEPQPDSYSFPTGDAAAAEDAYEGSETFGGDTEESNDMEVMLRAHETLAELARAPARLEHLASLLIADVSPLVGANVQALQNLADVIVDCAESSPNVSYTCAQLCSHLNESGIGGSPDAFRLCLLRKCANTSKKLQSAPGSAERRWFTTFLAELFVAITIPLDSSSIIGDTGAQVMKSASLSKGVKRLLMALLGGGTEEPQPSDDDLKCVAQVLKLCGWELASFEMDNSSSSSSATSLASTSATSVTSSASAMSSSGVPSPSVSDILKALRSRRDRAGVSCQRLIDSVVMLEASGWGRSQSATDVATPAPGNLQAAAVAPNEQQYQQQHHFQCEPVFYSHDGREITRREAGFADFEDDEVQSEGYECGVSAGQDGAIGGGDVWNDAAADFDDLELNDEIYEAYEAFCEQNATANRDQQYQSKFS